MISLSELNRYCILYVYVKNATYLFTNTVLKPIFSEPLPII